MKKIVRHEKILFKLEKDSDDYPPDDWESLWGLKLDDDLYTIDNIPFYIRGISPGDVVSVDKRGTELFFRELVTMSGHSVLRAIVFDPSDIEALVKSLEQMSCGYEGSHIPGFVAFDCPPTANFGEVEQYLEKGEAMGKWEYEAASIRHD